MQDNDLPDDLRLITLKYGGDCRACGTELPPGRRAHWSPSSRAVWCHRCFLEWKGPAEPDAAENTSQEQWTRLCRYLSKCVLAEAANTLARFRDRGRNWFPHDGRSELLVTGLRDSIPVPVALRRHLDQRNDLSYIYGWPTLVARDQKNHPMIAPLFMVPVRPERRHGVWVVDAKSEPELNLSIVAGNLFDLAMKDEIDAVVGDDLPFGDASALARVAREIAGVLNVRIVSGLDAGALGPCRGAIGLHNAAVWVVADEGRYAHRSLLDELEKLAFRRDWTKTAAACLVPAKSGNGKPARRPPKKDTAAPLPCNGSQELTLERLRRDPLTVVTGPPGTGKTQLVVNAVANAWLDGETVLVASTNNGAVDVAVDRAGKIREGMLLRTGNRRNVEKLMDQIPALLASVREAPGDAWEDLESEARARAELGRASGRRTRLFSDMTTVAELNRNLTAMVENLEELAREIWRNRVRVPNLALASRIIRRWTRRRPSSNLWLFLLRWTGCRKPSPRSNLLTHWTDVDRQRTRLTTLLSNVQTRIGDPDTSLRRVDKDWADASLAATLAAVRSGVVKGKAALNALNRVPPAGPKVAGAIRDCLRHARGWACTALSMKRNFRLEGGLFDLVIIDEASQCSLATALPLAYRSKRLAVIGDPHQLSPIVTLSDAWLRRIAESEHFDDDELARRGVQHKEGSAYHAFEHAGRRASQQPIVLDEHYRSHPMIARWFNNEFYQGELTVLTDVSEMPDNERSIRWIDIRGEARRGRAGSWTNVAEAEHAVRQLANLVQNAAGSAGVVTPFAAQAQLIRRLARQRLGDEHLADVDFVCGTAHRFQGGEKDTIVFSAVLTPGISTRTAAWVERERNLINVAVSRACRSLMVLGHPEIAAAGSRTLYSLRDYLQRKTAGDDDPTPETGKYRTDSRAEARLLEAMRDSGLRPAAKLPVRGYELDFALFEEGVRLNVEVDGAHHTDDRGKRRRQDIVRDRMFAGMGWSVLRIPAWRCIWDIDGAVRDIRERVERKRR